MRLHTDGELSYPHQYRSTGARGGFAVLSIAALVLIFGVEVRSLTVGLLPPTGTTDTLAILSTLIWAMTASVLTHQAIYRIASAIERPSRRAPSGESRPSTIGTDILLLYATCDDFDAEACQACVGQDYHRVRVIICDDSQSEDHRKRVDNFLDANRDRCEVSRRGSRAGYKAGNINHAIAEFGVPADWILVVDADQLLPTDYVSRIVAEIPTETERVGWVQGVAHARIGRLTLISEALAIGTTSYYNWDLPGRERYGFTSIAGHGVVFPYAAWRDVGGLPEVVSEDYAFAFRLRAAGRSSRIAWSAASGEGIPDHFSSFLIRIGKYSNGTAELARKEFPLLLRSGVRWPEKYDALMQLAYYPLSPLLILNGFITAIVLGNDRSGLLASQVMSAGIVFSAVLATSMVSIQSAGSVRGGLRGYLIAYSCISCATPLVAWKFVAGLFGPAVFERTPKGDSRSRLDGSFRLAMYALGLLAILTAFVTRSEFSLVLAGLGISWLCVDLYEKCDSSSCIGSAARLCLFFPALLTVAGGLGAVARFWRA